MSTFYQFDPRRQLALPGDPETTLQYATDLWIEIANSAIQDHDFFAVALSGGSTPKKIFQKLCVQKDELDWSKVMLFWSDERNVPPSDKESNFHMAMVEGKLSTLPIPLENIFRMEAESDLEANARAYQELIEEKLGGHPFDLVMLGMGDDGHTASLFPHTQALHVEDRLVTPNHVPQKKCDRMTFTYPCINASHHICLYVLGEAKADVLEKVLTGPYQPEEFPSQKIGTESHPALWIIDEQASKNLMAHLK